MPSERLWRKLLKLQAMRDQHAICPVCSLPLAIRYGLLTRIDVKMGFIPECVRLIHPECNTQAGRRKMGRLPCLTDREAAE
jgi:hypothetical protein